MDIRYLGHASFLIKGKTVSVVTDPFDPKMTGLKFPKVSADIVTVSHDHPDHNQSKLVEGSPFVIVNPGEYEKQGVKITGVGVFHDKKQGAERGRNTLFKIEIDGISLLHCGDLGHLLSEEILEELGKVDILLIPTGGVYTIDARDACVIVQKIEPAIVVPMHYQNSLLNQDGFAGLAPLSDFIKAMGVAAPEAVKKLTVKKEDLADEMKVIVLEIGG